MAKTKKVGITGKFGIRYGKRVRERVLKIEAQKSRICPNCFKPTLRRVAAGVWVCKKCKLKFAGKAYKPR